MKYDYILQLSNNFTKYAQNLSLKEIVNHLSEIKSFVARLRYCEQNFKKLGTGSARIAFLLPDGKVLKLAKNAKGLAQNRTESDWSIKSDIFNRVLDADNNNQWMITNLATKITPAFFEAQAGISINKLGEFLRYWHYHEVKGHEENEFIPKPQNYDKIKENLFISELMEVTREYGLSIGDFWKLSSYGNVGGKLTVVDFGLTENIYNQYYKR